VKSRKDVPCDEQRDLVKKTGKN